MLITDLKLSDLTPDPDNIRDSELDDISALAADIKAHGVQVPLRVYPSGMRWSIWAGHRRWAALCMNGASYAPCVITAVPGSALEKLDGMVSENVHRKDLNPVELARVFVRYRDAELDQAAIAVRCGTSQSKVSTHLQMLAECSPAELARVAGGEISVHTMLKTIKRRRAARGVARSDAGAKHSMSTWVPHFNSQHPLVTVAAQLCIRHAHDAADRIGGACGPCWEAAIRRDERVAADLESGLPPGERMPPMRPGASPPNPLSCARCRVPYSSERKQQACVVTDTAAKRRYRFDAHDWRHAADRGLAAG